MTDTARQTETQPKPGVLVKLAALQAVATALIGLILLYFFDLREAVSAVLGGGIAIVMTLFMALRLFSAHRVALIRDVSAQETLIRFYLSVILKVLFTLVMMAMCLIVIKVSVLPFIIAYLMAAMVVNWLSLLWLDHD